MDTNIKKILAVAIGAIAIGVPFLVGGMLSSSDIKAQLIEEPLVVDEAPVVLEAPAPAAPAPAAPLDGSASTLLQKYYSPYQTMVVFGTPDDGTDICAVNVNTFEIVGTYDSANAVCNLTADISTFDYDNYQGKFVTAVTNNVTLDGNGHTISNGGGILIDDEVTSSWPYEYKVREGVKVQNVTFDQLSEQAIYSPYIAKNITFENNTISNFQGWSSPIYLRGNYNSYYVYGDTTPTNFVVKNNSVILDTYSYSVPVTIDNANHLTIEGNTLSNGYRGLSLNTVSNFTIKNNTITNSGTENMYIYSNSYSYNGPETNLISGNTMTLAAYGFSAIDLYNTRDTLVEKNTMTSLDTNGSANGVILFNNANLSIQENQINNFSNGIFLNTQYGSLNIGKNTFTGTTGLDIAFGDAFLTTPSYVPAAFTDITNTGCGAITISSDNVLTGNKSFVFSKTPTQVNNVNPAFVFLCNASGSQVNNVQTEGLLIKNSDKVKINNVVVSDGNVTPASQTSNGLKIVESNNAELTNVQVKDIDSLIGSFALSLNQVSNSKINNVKVLNNTSASGAEIKSTTGVMSENTTINNAEFSNNADTGLTLGENSKGTTANNVQANNNGFVGIAVTTVENNINTFKNTKAQNNGFKDVTLNLSNCLGKYDIKTTPGKSFVYATKKTTLNGGVYSDIILCNADGSSVTGVTAGSITLRDTDNATVATSSAPTIELFNATGNTVNGNIGTDLTLSSSSNNTISNNTSSKLSLQGSSNNTIQENIVNANYYNAGIEVAMDYMTGLSSDTNALIGNTINGAYYSTGIQMSWGVAGNSINENKACGNTNTDIQNYGDGTTGDNNTCDLAYGYHDASVVFGCKNTCN